METELLVLSLLLHDLWWLHDTLSVPRYCPCGATNSGRCLRSEGVLCMTGTEPGIILEQDDNEICALLGYYAALSGSSWPLKMGARLSRNVGKGLPGISWPLKIGPMLSRKVGKGLPGGTFWPLKMEPMLSRNVGKGLTGTSWPLNMGHICCPKTSIKDYQGVLDPWRWDRYVVPKRRQRNTRRDILTLENGTHVVPKRR
jgi:hypothetical protein